MAPTLGTQTLQIQKWQEDIVPTQSLYDKWTGGTCVRTKVVYGYVRTYTLDCIEQNVSWANSLANYAEQQLQSGAQLAFSSDLAIRPVSSTYVTVEDVNWTEENVANQNIRIITLTLMEVA